jgi:hypothetical protein
MLRAASPPAHLARGQIVRPGGPDPVEGRYSIPGNATHTGRRLSRARGCQAALDAMMAQRLRDAGIGDFKGPEINGLSDLMHRFWQNEPNFI